MAISGVPGAAQSLALIMHDPNAVGGQDFLHWAVWNIDPQTTLIDENSVPQNARQGLNDYPTVAYGPACPPPHTGTHHYTFYLFALDSPMSLPEGTDRQTLETTIKSHVIASAQLIAIVES